MEKKWLFWGLCALLLALPIIQAATFASTLFVWNAPAGTRSYTLTYGAACNASAFYFNEIDANYDPDNDGNGARIPPTANLVSDTNVILRDYNYEGVISPSSGPTYAYAEVINGPPSTPADIINEYPTDDDYLNVTTEDDALYQELANATAGEYLGEKFVFKVSQNPLRIKRLIFKFAGASYDKVSGDPCSTDTLGQEITTYIRLWDWTSSTYIDIASENTSRSSPLGQTYDAIEFPVDSNVYKYIGSDTNVVFTLASDAVTADTGCMILDYVELNVEHYPDTNVFCQTSTIAPITITNAGGTDLNIDGNFSTAFSGNDINLVLKVWQGTGSGCGTAGMGGWEKDCSVTNALTDLGMTTCRQYNQQNATSNGRLVTRLLPGDSNQLCFSGDINTFTRRGTYAKTFQVGDYNS